MDSAKIRTERAGTAAMAGTAALAVNAPAIQVEQLRKTYGQRDAVRNLSFAVQPGEIFALLGPNGAGKTTTVEMLEGYRAPDGGAVRVLGLDPRRDSAQLKPRIGVMLQHDGLYPGLRALEVVRLYASFFRDPEDPRALLERVGLREAAHTRCRQLSGGQRRRLALAVAVVGRPRLLFLDEPTTGMDPQARRATWELIRGLQADGATVLLTTHFMDEAERLADRIAILDGGELIALDTPAGLTVEQSTTNTTVYLTAPPGLDIAALGKLPSARTVRAEGPGRYALETGDARGLLAEVTAWLRDQGADATELRVGRSSLEDVFLRLTGKDMRE